MNIRAEFVFGKPNDNQWSDVFGFRPDSHKDFFKYGEMYLVIRIGTEAQEFPIKNLAKIILSELQQAYFERESEGSDSALENLEDAIWKMKAKLEVVLSREQRIIEKGLDLEMAIAVYIDNVVYAAVIGESKIFIFRDGNFVDISEALVDNRMSDFVRTGSLELQTDDRIALLTSVAKEKLGEEIVQEVLSELDCKKLDVLNQVPGASCMILAEDSLNWKEIPEEELVEHTEIMEEVEEQIDADEEAVVSQAQNLQDELSDDEFEDPLQLEEDTASKLGLMDRLKLGLNTAKLKGEELITSIKSKRNADSKAKAERAFINTSLEDIDEEDFGEVELTDDSPIRRNVKNASMVAASSVQKITNKVKTHFKDNQTTYAAIISTTATRIKNFLIKIKEIFEREIIGRDLGGRRYMLDRKKKVKRNRILFVIITLVLIVFIYTNVQNARENKKKQEELQLSQEKLADFNQRYQTLNSSVLNSNTQTPSQKQTTLDGLNALEQDIKAYDATTSLNDAELEDLLSNIQVAKDDLLSIEGFSQAQVVADVGAQFADTQLTDLEYSEGSLFVSDTGRNVIYKFATELNSQLQVHISSLNKPTLLVKNALGEIIFYDSDTDRSIGKFNPNQTESVVRFGSLPLSEVGGANEVGLYENNDALYEIRQANSQIYKRERQGDGYKSGGAAFNAENPPNWKNIPELSRAVDISVPFELYALIQGVGLQRYLSGGDNTLTFDLFNNILQSDYDLISNGTSLDVTTNYVAVGIPTAKRVMLFSIDNTNPSKPLKLEKQFEFRGSDNTFSGLQELKINETNRKIFVLDNAKVLRLDF